MQIIGVVDLLGGRAVHARAGRREGYAPVRVVDGSPIEPGDALALARAYLDHLGLTELYAADLDAILEGTPQDMVVAAVAALGAPLWLDAGASSADRARHVLGLGALRVVVGLETLASYDALGAICAAVGGDRVAFSLDLRNGVPIVLNSAANGVPSPAAPGSPTRPRVGVGAAPNGVIQPNEPAHVVAARAAAAGAGAVILIDLARVGTDTGLDLGLIARVREAVPGLRLLAGGGVRGLEDLARLADVGCDGALVATALHNGRLGPAEVAAARRWSA